MTKSVEEYREGKRLHPLTLLYKGITSSTILIIPLYFAMVQGDTKEWVYIVIISFILFVSLPSNILSYFFFTFFITPKEIVIRSGVLSRKQRNIPIKKVQNINIEQNVFMRLLGLSKVQLETAGDVQTEGVLEFVSKADAEEIKSIIKAYQYQYENEDINENVDEDALVEEAKDLIESEYESSEDNATPLSEKNIKQTEKEEENEKVLFTSKITDAIYFGAMRLRPVVLIIAFWLLSISFQFDFLPSISELGVEDFIAEISSLNPFIVFLYLLALVISMIILTIVIDIILTINQYYGFKLSKENSKLYTKYGLLTRRHATIPLKKLQSLTIYTHPFKKKFDYYTLAIQTAGIGERGGAPESAIPYGRFHQLMDVISKIYDFTFPEKLNPVSKLTIRRAFIRYNVAFLIILALVHLIMSFSFSSVFSYIWIVAVFPILWYGAVLRYRYRGYFITDDKVIIKQGFWFQRTTVIQIKKIQTLSVKETFFQRRLNLATLNIDTASTSVLSDASIIDIDKDDAKELMNEILEKFRIINK